MLYFVATLLFVLHICYTRADGLSTGEVRFTLGCTMEKIAITVSGSFCSDICTENLCNLDKCRIPVSPYNKPVRPARCYSCEYLSNPEDCSNMVQCKLNEVCYVRKVNVYGHVRFNLGCMDSKHCTDNSQTSVGNISAPLVGRRLATTNSTCSLCCTTDHCNAKACSERQHRTVHSLQFLGDNLTCQDHNTEACTDFGLLNDNACAVLPNIDHMCPNTCGICGHYGWSEWSNWTDCSTSCGDGTGSRSRTCLYQTERALKHTCQGNATETRSCNEGVCIVEGFWTGWEAWVSCSVTCGNGTKLRRRQCHSNRIVPGGLFCMGQHLESTSCDAGRCPDFELSCPDDWIPHHFSCYYFSTNNSSFDSSKRMCNTYSSTLVQIGSADENKFIVNHIKSLAGTGSVSYWLGIKMSYFGSWTWTDSSQRVNFTSWYTGEGQSSGEDCAVLYGPYNFMMADVSCDRVDSRALCERHI